MGDMAIRDLPADQRPRERMSRLGADALTDAEVLALVLGSGSRGVSAIALAHRVLGAHGGCGGLDRATLDSLRRVPGIGTATACRILAVSELARRVRREDRPVVLSTSADVAAVVLPELADRQVERMVVVVLGRGLRLIDVVTVAKGHANEVSVPAAEILQAVLSRGGSAFALAHNHPGGSCTPSETDVTATSAIQAAAGACGLRFLDHILVAGEAWRSITS